MKTIFFAVLSLVALSCVNNDLSPSSALEGKWVEVTHETDTLTFRKMDQVETLFLGRGKEMRNGFLQPKYGSGPYEYQLLSDQIFLRSYLSSSTKYQEYSFARTDAGISIGNFYEEGAAGEILIFRKLE